MSKAVCLKILGTEKSICNQSYVMHIKDDRKI